MKTLLQLHTSLNGADSLSSSLANDYTSRWLRANPGGRVIERDLATTPVPHLSAETFAAFLGNADGGAASGAVTLSDELIGELQAADEVVLAVPMYNFGIPSTLKAYFDHVARAGVTFHYTSEGPEGLLTGKRALVFATRGGRYAGTPNDVQSGYLRIIFDFLGFDATEFVYAEGTAMGEEALQSAVSGARLRITELSAAA